MAVLSYVTEFQTRIIEMYGHLLVSDPLFHSNENIDIVNAREIKLPRLTVSGYKDHRLQCRKLFQRLRDKESGSRQGH